ncbi:MAG: hypothetical protein ACI8UO_002432 [Verrucomicrobiales bacterium]|jgi:hypothetical protein
MKQAAWALIFSVFAGAALGEEPAVSTSGWKLNGLAKARFELSGTESRNNPLRQQLLAPFSGDELFVRYLVRYDASTIDTPVEDEGEFFVLWLDQAEGGETSNHSGGVPNLGIHVLGEANHFMARFGSGGEKFGPELVGDRDFLVVGRLWKSSPGTSEPFDQLDLWVDPDSVAEFSPAASVKSPKSISEVRWIGFSTGAKTEVDDRIEVWDIDVASTWEGILGLPPKTEPTAPPLEKSIDFVEQVYPILESRCFKCHEGEDAKKGIRLDALDEVLNRTDRLLELVAAHEMPPEDEGEPLSLTGIATLRTWIDEGLDWSEDLLPTPIPKTDHWAFQPILSPEIPQVRNSDWVRTPVDNFIARRHESLGLKPAPEANTETLARRISLDLTGLPSMENRTVDELLTSSAYGERWGRFWLDVARWAESNGHQHNRDRPYAWRYRDYVVDAFKNDKPFDQFIREQLAGDEIDSARDENLIATGFLAAARYSGNELDKDIQRNDILVDVTNTTASAFLGLTVECAQCHTHKFDPISIRDYYRMQAVFAKAQPGNLVLAVPDEGRALVRERWRIFDDVHARIVAVKRKQGTPEPIYVIPKSVISGMRPEEKKRFDELEAEIAKLPQTWAYAAPDQQLLVAPHTMRWPLPKNPAGDTFLLVRGEVKSRGPEVEPGWPAVFGPTPSNSEKPRLAFSEWLTNPENPLTARVWVNRIWQWHFGRGIVETSADFGTQGTEPSHPELLDFLASELISSGWSTRHVHRLIVNSATYRQSSTFSAASAAIDPDNRAFWRWTPRRLEAEAARDSILAVSGLLDSSRGGPSVEHDSKRRSLYLKQKRDHLPHQQLLFDSGAGVVSCSRRRVSTTALQPLWLMNSEFVQEAAEKLAGRSDSIEEAIRLAYGREPEAEELALLGQLEEESGLASVCLALLNSSEFLYIP